MTAVRKASKFTDRQGAAILAMCIVETGLLIAMLSFVSEIFWQKVAGVIWFVAMAASLVAIVSIMGRSFSCPECGGPVGPHLETDGKAGTPILRHCPKCDVLWQVGVESDS
jgi:hypothetical protein